MLHILTGDIQIGKTRWLKRQVEALSEQGVSCYGVVSPGIWLEHPGLGGSIQYEKTGIDVVLLPQGRKLPFAQRRDLAQDGSSQGTELQSSKAGLGWAIADKSIAAVNDHFDWIAATAVNDAATKTAAGQQGLLVIDELGRLELMHGCGFSSAVRLLERGPTNLYADALVVVRDTLAKLVEQRFASRWGTVKWLSPE